MSLLNVQLNPTYTVNRVTVLIVWPGANPVELDAQVSRPLALALNALANTDRIRTYTRRGRVTSRIDFRAGTEMQAGFADVQSAVGSINFPAESEQPKIRLHTPVERVSRMLVTGDFTERTAVALANDIVERIRQQGISNVSARAVARSPYMIDVDPVLARAHDISLSQIAEAVREALGSASGNLTGAGGQQQAVQVMATHSPESLADIPATVPSRGVRVGDLAAISREPRESTGKALFELGNGFSLIFCATLTKTFWI